MTCWRRVLLCLSTAVLLLVFAGNSHPIEARTNRDAAADAKKKPPEPGPVLAVVSLGKQRISIYGRTGLMAESAVSTGMPGHRTPAGVFSVLQKSKFHRSNIYWNAPMPYMQRITWSGVTLHAGVVPGYPASHGCIRMPHRFAVELWAMTKVGARVVVVQDDTPAVPIERSLLPRPRLTPAPAEGGGQRQEARAQVPALGGAGAVKVADASAGPTSAAARQLNPMERARLTKALAVATAAAKAKAAKAAADSSALKAAAAKSAGATLRASESALALAGAKRDAAARAIDRPTTPAMAERAKLALTSAEERLAEAEKAHEDARAVAAAATEEAIAAAKLAADAEDASGEAAAALKIAERGTEPISILVSKKAQRLYIRQAWTPIYEAPIVFKDAQRPIGTHVYLAVAPEDNGEVLRWLSVSPRSLAATQPRTRQHEAAVLARAPRPDYAQETAASALARFELPEEARRFIEERLWTGASLIISDEGISNETGTYTDFIVLTR